MQLESGRQKTTLCFWVAVWLSTTPVTAKVIWRGDFEMGTTAQWRGAPKSDAVRIVKEPVREGKFAVRIDGTNAARKGNWDRIEFQHQPDPPGTAEGTERYFGWSVYLPKKLTEGVHALGYFETRQSWRQLMSFEVRGEDILFSTRVPYARQWDGKGKLTAGRWHDFAVHVLWSRDPAKGFVEVWFDGENVVPRVKTATLLDENVAFFQIGLFRDTIDIPETIVIDHVIEATTLAEVTPPQLAQAGRPESDQQLIAAYRPRWILPAREFQSSCSQGRRDLGRSTSILDFLMLSRATVACRSPNLLARLATTNSESYSRALAYPRTSSNPFKVPVLVPNVSVSIPSLWSMLTYRLHRGGGFCGSKLRCWPC